MIRTPRAWGTAGASMGGFRAANRCESKPVGNAGRAPAWREFEQLGRNVGHRRPIASRRQARRRISRAGVRGTAMSSPTQVRR